MCAVLMELEEDYTDPPLFPVTEQTEYQADDVFAMVALHINEEE